MFTISDNDTYDTDDCLIGETTGLLSNPSMSGNLENDAWASEGAAFGVGLNSAMDSDSVSIGLRSNVASSVERSSHDSQIIHA